MKATIQHIPASSSSFHLTGEIGWYGATFIWMSNAYHIDGIVNYVFEEADEKTAAQELLEILENFKNFDNKKNLFYNFRESVLVPATFFKEELASDLINEMFVITKDEKVLFENSQKLVNVYAVPSSIHQFVLNNNIPYVHSGTCQHHDQEGVNIIFYHNAFKIIIHQFGKLHFMQQFSFKNPLEAAYHILNVCRQHELDIEEEIIHISGMVDENSQLYKELSKFCMLHFATHKDLQKADDLQAYPDHFFHHLIALSTCVS